MGTGIGFGLQNSGLAPIYYSYGWTHVSADHNNLIDTQKITQIPAVKGYMLTGDADVIKGPGSTGGDLVQLRSGGLVRIKVTLPTNGPAYRMRIRYANNSPASLGVDCHFPGNTLESDQYDIPATYTGGNLTYNAFAYQDTLLLPATTNERVAEIYVSSSFNSSNNKIIIDKIEFIPM
ncbi:delta endotoxin C-terminal domain-containing protein [Bacillus cereus group sp. IBL03679]|uniref:delta endotoxin C-terminal domain-containing protein n=1 Tax=Bacillus cereus group sp. IBL03679 TaxID=3240095 RepID=UPI003D2F8995